MRKMCCVFALLHLSPTQLRPEASQTYIQDLFQNRAARENLASIRETSTAAAGSQQLP